MMTYALMANANLKFGNHGGALHDNSIGELWQETLGDDDKALDGASDLYGDLLSAPDYPDAG